MWCSIAEISSHRETESSLGHYPTATLLPTDRRKVNLIRTRLCSLVSVRDQVTEMLTLMLLVVTTLTSTNTQ